MPIRVWNDPQEFEYIDIDKTGNSEINLPPIIFEMTIYHWLIVAWALVTLWIARKVIYYYFRLLLWRTLAI